MKRRICRRCVRSAMLYKSKTWRVRENVMVILKKTEKAICKVKLIEKGNS